MKILDACFLFHKMTIEEIQRSTEVTVYNFFDTAYIEKRQESLLILKRAVDLLCQWHITPKIFDFNIAHSEQQVIEAARELIGAVCDCIDSQSAIINQRLFNNMIEGISEEEKENYMIRFMEKYLKAASIYSGKSCEEKKDFLIYAFDIDEENVSDVLSRLEKHTQHLEECRDAFIVTAVSWNRNRIDKKDRTEFVEEELKKDVTVGVEEQIDQNYRDASENLSAMEGEKRSNEYEKTETLDGVNETEEAILKPDVFDMFYQIMEDDTQEVQFMSSSERVEEDTEIAEREETAEDTGAVGEEETVEDTESIEEEEVAEDTEAAEEEETAEDTEAAEEEETAEDTESIEEEEAAEDVEAGEKEDNREKAKQEMQSVLKEEVWNRKKETAVHHVKEEIGVSDEAGIHEIQDEFLEKCSQILQRWIDMLQRGEKVQPSDESETDGMCWELLLKGEFMLAREIAATFHEISSAKCVSSAVIDVVGSGLFMPVTEKTTQQYFLSCQPLLQFDQLEKWEQTAVVLAALPIAHCCFEIRLDNAMLQALSGIFRKWADQLLKCRNEVTYIDRNAIETYRIFQVRMKRIKNIQEKARKQFEGMYNSNIAYELANKVLSAVCGKDQCIGILWALMNEMDPEYLALGTANSTVEELYRRGRVYIPEKKNTLKSIDEGLINKIVEEGRKKYGYKTEIVGTPKHKMTQMIGEFLMSANEWLELIGNPCDYNRYDPSSKFMQKLSESYRKYRSELYQDVEKQKGEYLPNIYKNMLAAMDYLIGIQEDMPSGCKSYLEHMYRLCAIPNLYIKKNELGIYRCECQNQIEYLIFLNKVMRSGSCTVDDCLEKFVEADAFSGCSVIFDVMKQRKTKDYVKIRERYERRVQKRLDELKCNIVQMKKDLYQLSVYSGWLGNDYFVTLSKITMLERMVKEELHDLTLLCASVKECSDSVECLVKRFRGILQEQVEGNFNEEQSSRLYALIEEGQYAAVIEWTAHISISDAGAEEADFFKERYFNYNTYCRKEKSLLQDGGIRDLVHKLQDAIMKATSWEGFDFNRVPGSIGNRRALLISLWYQIKSELQNIAKFRMEENRIIFKELEQMLKMLGWDVTGLEKCKFCEDESGGYLQFDMYFKPTHSRDRCPVPLFGSDSNGRIRMICLYGSANAPDKQYDLFENKSQQIPMIMLFFGVMTHKRRMELYSTALNKQSTFLVVDDIIITTICERRETMLLRWLYTLAVPFSVQKLYTTALGVVHPEMFYGRVSAKAELGLNGAVCAVYGGRQLGKTALLKNIEVESHDPEIDHFVYYIPLPTVVVEYPDAVLTKEIVNTMGKDILVGRKCENMDEVLEDISEWIRQKETRRLLLLLDEADEFLLADGKNGFRVTSGINRIMTVSNLRFKVVFAGLHNVYRSVSSPNNPLAHYGKPISIGPLLDDELQDAINLVRQPFEIMGYRFESLDLIIWILAETNYYPGLIQLFCMKLHDYLQQPEIRKMRSGALPVIIRREDIDSVLKDRSLKKSICERFMWTLDLDDRYKAIALSIAFDAGYASKTDTLNDFVKGYDLQWIHSEIEKWPNLFKEHSSLDDVRGLCDELVQLGILRGVSSDRYILRSANILEMLGTQESILRKLYELESRHYDYDKMYNGTLYRSIFRDREAGCKCYPLTNQQIHSALDTGGIKLIIGSHALGIDSIEKCLRELLALDMDHPSQYDLYQQKKYKLYVHNTRFPDFEELGDSMSVHLVHWECTWKFEDLKPYKYRLDALEEQNRPILLLLCDEKRSWKLWENFPVDAFEVPVIRLATWDLEAVQFWLNESSAPPLLMDDLIQIMKRLCGWPAAMYQLWDIMAQCRHEPDFMQSLLEQTVAHLTEDSSLFGFLAEENPEPLLPLILDIYARYETDMTCEDIQYVLEEEHSPSSMEQITHAVAWMADMGLLNRQIQNKETDAGNKKMKYGIDSLILELWKGHLESV